MTSRIVVRVGEQHHQPVDADAEAAGRRQAVLERPQVVLVDDHRLVVAGRLLPGLVLEAGPLLVGVDELAEGVARARGRRRSPSKRSTMSGQLAVVARERRDLLRVVDDEHRAPELGLGGLLVDLEHELAGPVVGLHLDAVLVGDAPQLVDRHADVDVDAGVLLDEVGQRWPAATAG